MAADLMRPGQQAREPKAVAVRLLLGALVIWAVAVLVGYLLGHQLRHSGLVRWDASVDRNLATHRSAGWNTVTEVATYCAETITVISIGVITFVALRWRLHRWREALFVAITVIGEVAIFVCTTLMVDRHRPPVPHLDSAPPTSSFPSGHTAASVALYGSLAVLAWRLGAAAWLRTLATVLAVLMPIAVASSRLYRGMHYPTDVLAGATLALCWLLLTSRWVLVGSAPARSRPLLGGR